jgi:PAS domain S-box-containing protein
LVIVDTAGKIVFANSQAEKVFGYPSQELLGQPVETLIPEQIRRAHLRDRAADIPLLVHFFLARFAKRMGKNVAIVQAETMQALCRCSWPGNVRG